MQTDKEVIELSKKVISEKKSKAHLEIMSVINDFYSTTGLQLIVEHLEVPGYGDQGNRHTVTIRVEI